MSDTTPAGWQPDPTGRHDHRYWDGAAWTDNISDAGVAGTDPFSAPATPDPTVTDVPVTPAAPVPPTDVTAAWSTTPGAPVPPVPPVPPTAAASGGSGSSKKGLLIGGGILVVIALVVGFLLLGGDDDEDEVRGQLIGALTDPDQGDLSQDDAECVADEVMDDVDVDVLKDVDYTADDPPEELQGAILRAYQTCDVDFGGGSADETTTTEGNDDETTTTSESSSDGGSSDGGSTGGTIPDGFVDQLADTFVSTLGISQEQADCLAQSMSEDIASGDLSEEAAPTEFLDYFADCDISMSDIGAN